VSVRDSTGWRAFSRADGLPGDVVYSIERSSIEPALIRGDSIHGDASLGLRFSADGGVCTYAGGTWHVVYSTDDGLPHATVHATLRDARGNLWFATRKGLARLDTAGTWTTFLDGRNVRGLLEDREGNLWFGTAGHGAMRFDGRNWQTFTPARVLIPQIVDRHGRVWLSSERGGAFMVDGDTWTRFGPSDGLASTIVFDIAEDGDGNLWFATAGGVSRLQAP
jgi:ligand-binding sensor domain-containing protein